MKKCARNKYSINVHVPTLSVHNNKMELLLLLAYRKYRKIYVLILCLNIMSYYYVLILCHNIMS